MILKFAIRNILRNRKRTLVSAMSVFGGAFFVGVIYAYLNGMMDMLVSNYVKYQTGNVRITTEEFLNRQNFFPVDELVDTSGTMIEDIEKIDGVTGVEKRVRFGILLVKDNIPLQVIGIGLDIENNSFQLRDRVVEGSLDESGVFLGKRLAQKLGKKVGDELLIASETSMGGFNGLKLPVKAIIETKVIHYDERFLYLPMPEAERLLKLRGNAPEVLVYAEHGEDTTINIKSNIDLLLDDGLEAQTYMEQMGGFYDFIGVAKTIYFFIELAILFLACVVIVNTMMMAIFERMREIGTMKALGFTEGQLFGMFTAEGAVIGAIGGIPGAICGWSLIYYLSVHGLNLGDALTGVDYPMEYILYPHSRPSDLIAIFIIVLVVPSISAMIPSRYIKRYQPADALRM